MPFVFIKLKIATFKSTALITNYLLSDKHFKAVVNHTWE